MKCSQQIIKRFISRPKSPSPILPTQELSSATPEAEERTASATRFALRFNEKILPGLQFVLHDSL